MLVVSLRGVSFGFWSHLGYVLGKTPSYLNVKVSFRVARENNINIYIYCLCFKMVSFRGQKKLGPRWSDRSPLGV